MTARRFKPKFLLGLLALPTALLAQEHREYRYSCTSAQEAVREGVTGGAYVQALYTLTGCGRRGIEVLARQWEGPPLGATERGFLETVSAYTPDRTVFEVVRRVALDRGETLELRFHALAVMIRYLDDRARPRLTDQPLPGDRAPEGSDYARIWRTTGGPTRPGRVPPPGPAVDRIAKEAFPALVRRQLIDLSREEGPMGLIAAYFFDELFPDGDLKPPSGD